MANIDPLPPPIDQVDVPESFNVSNVSNEIQCELKTVLSSTTDAPSLPTHPRAEIGRLFHTLIERAIRGRIDRSGLPEDDAKRELERLLAKSEKRLQDEKKTQRYAQLSKTVTPLRWRQKTIRIVESAAKWLKKSPRGSKSAQRRRNRYSKGGDSLEYRSLGESGRWTEVNIHDEELRLKGRMDLVEKKGGTVVIRDFKTGRVTDGEGVVLAYIKRQLRLYGLMAKRATPTAHIELIAEGEREHTVGFDDETMAKTEARVQKLTSRLPRGKVYPAAALAQPGAACAACRYRHVCSAYLRSAPEKWREETSYRLPLDTWGAVKGITAHSENLVDLALKDESGRRIKIFDLAREHLQDIRTNKRLYFFNLKAYPRSRDEDRWRHPINFFEVSVDEPSKRAWTLRIYEHVQISRSQSPCE